MICVGQQFVLFLFNAVFNNAKSLIINQIFLTTEVTKAISSLTVNCIPGKANTLQPTVT